MVKHITYLLHRHNCVIVPGLGGFVGEYRPARIHPGNQELLPPSKSIAFNVRLDRSDGLLAQHLVSTEGLTYEEAEKQISEYARRCLHQLKTDRALHLSGLGRLVLDSEGKLRFSPEEGTNYLADSFGLRSFQAQPILRDKVEAIERGIAKTKAQKELARVSIPGRTVITVGEEEPAGDHIAMRTWLYAAAVILVLFGVYQTLAMTEVIPGAQALWLGSDKADEIEEGMLFRASPIVPNLIKAMADIGSTTSLSAVAPGAVVPGESGTDWGKDIVDTDPTVEESPEPSTKNIPSKTTDPEPVDVETKNVETGVESKPVTATGSSDANYSAPEIGFSHGASSPQRGYYVVIGSYRSQSLAEKRLRSTNDIQTSVGLYNPAVLKGHNGFYRAGVFVDENESQARKRLPELRNAFKEQDSWILKY